MTFKIILMHLTNFIIKSSVPAPWIWTLFTINFIEKFKNEIPNLSTRLFTHYPLTKRIKKYETTFLWPEYDFFFFILAFNILRRCGMKAEQNITKHMAIKIWYHVRFTKASYVVPFMSLNCPRPCFSIPHLYDIYTQYHDW